jgi:hypothetical protein
MKNNIIYLHGYEVNCLQSRLLNTYTLVPLFLPVLKASVELIFCLSRFFLSLGNRKEAQGAISDEWGGCITCGIL